MLFARVCAVSLVAALVIPVIAPAEEISQEQIAGLVQQLDGDTFAARQQAEERLTDAGKAAIAPLVEAISGGNREVTMRAINILRKHYNSGDADLKGAAKVALTKVAAGSDVAAASRAKEILKPKPAAEPPAGGRRIIGGFGGGNVIQLRVQIGGGGRKIKVQQNNGVKEIEVEEKDRKIKIHEDKKGIKIEVTETKDGKPQTKKYKAKDADELKKKHPEAHKLYEKYSGKQVQIMRGIKIAPGIRPQRAVPRRIQPARPAPPKDATKQIEDTIKRLEKMADKLKNRPGANKEAIQRMIKRLEETKKRLQEKLPEGEAGRE